MSKLKAIRTIPPAYINAQHRRQRVLNFLHANPASAIPAIATNMREHGDMGNVDNPIRTLLLFGEISYTGGHGRRKYSAIAVTTRSAEQVMHDRENKIIAKHFETDPKPVNNKSPGYYMHVMGERPIRNQEAQGSGRQRVWVGGTGAMV